MKDTEHKMTYIGFKKIKITSVTKLIKIYLSFLLHASGPYSFNSTDLTLFYIAWMHDIYLYLLDLPIF